METLRRQLSMPQLPTNHHPADPTCKPTTIMSYNSMPGPTDITNDGNNNILSDFQLAELHQTLDTLSNIPSLNGTCVMPYPPSQQPPPNGSSTQQSPLLFEVPSAASQLRMHGSHSFTNGINVRQNNSNKRLSVDMSGNVAEYPGELWPGPSRSSTSISHEDNTSAQISRSASGQDLRETIPNGASIYPTTTKRQNVGRHNNGQTTLANGPNMTNFMLVNHNQRMPYPQNPQFSQLPPMGQQPTSGHFYARPRLFDSTNFSQRLPARDPTLSHMMYTPPPRVPQSYQQAFFRQPQPKNIIYETVNQQNTTGSGTNSSTGDSVAQSEKRSRFMRTAQLLEQSGLMEVTMKTAALIKENLALQRDIEFLMAETMQIEQNLTAIKTGNAVNSHFILQDNFHNGQIMNQMSQPQLLTGPNSQMQQFPPPPGPGSVPMQRHVLY
ncbi:hypothetical protein RvY_09536 [Ramazzottius varieornatus]|uniref:Uncharacterized protein n=1 Tax=Ramazzottius varieornatus TaxID=947166 RepID=A0A1D1V9L7_RAMVA|nr:hypothetical protein RvY_09536 [Ramazzottius varieornatus]